MVDSVTEGKDRIETVDAYFRKVDAWDASVLDLCTEDIQLFFPKFGLAHGKAAVAEFSRRLTRELESLEHDIDGFHHIAAGDFVVVEGTERGVTRAGIRWPDGVVSQGRFCNVFEFDGPLIRRVHIYVDPDYTSADQDRIRILRGDRAGDDTRAAVTRYFEAERAGAAPEAVASLFSEDVDWDIPGAVDRVPWIGRRRGRAGVADFVRDLRAHIEPIRFEIHAIIVDGDRGIASGTLESRARRTGKVMDSEFAIDFTVRGGLITRYRMFEDSFAVAEAASEDP